MNRTIQLQEAFKLALSMVLFYWLALWMDWDLPKFGALAIVVISLSTTGASINKGIMRVVGTGLGALAGFALLSGFAQSPAGLLLAVAVYLVVIGYFIQTARQGDIWFNAGFMPVAIWASSYMQVESAFHIANARFLETAAGVLIFSLVSALLWPRTSGQALAQQGQAIWDGFTELFGQYRRLLAGELPSTGAVKLRTGLAGDYQQMLTTLQAAYSDTPVVLARKQAWELLRTDLRLFGNAQELWRESIDDCRKLDLHTLLPGLDAALDILAQRLRHGSTLWQPAEHDAGADVADDHALMAPIDTDIDAGAAGSLSAFEHAAVMNFVGQLRILDRSSRSLLQTLQVLAQRQPLDSLRERTGEPDPYRPSRWNPERLIAALFPAVCWAVAWLFWFYVEPPGGPAIPMMAAAFSLSMVMAPVNLLGLLIVLLLSMFITVAPVYMFVMPALDSGFALLALLFVYTFIFGYLGGKSPVLKLGPLMMFVMMVDITNDQTYSFMALVTAGLMMLLGISVVVVVDRLLSPMHPEQVLLRSVRRFLGGCARIVGETGLLLPRQPGRARRLRRRIYESRVLPVTAQLPGLEKTLNYDLFPDNSPEKVQRLVDGLQSIRWRLQSLELTYDRAARESPELMQAIAPLNEKWRTHVQDWLRKWARLVTAGGAGKDTAVPIDVSMPLMQQLDDLRETSGMEGLDDRALQHLYAVMGSTQSLLEALRRLGESMQQINWHQWSAARF
jgi:uncharacterized membrane protein YccC